MGRRVSFDSSSIKHFPQHGVTVQRKPDRLYVMCRKFYLDNQGLRHEHRVYIGHVINNTFFTSEESFKRRLAQQGISTEGHVDFDPGLTKLTLHQIHLLQQFYLHNPEFIRRSPITVKALALFLQELAVNAEHPLWQDVLHSLAHGGAPRPKHQKSSAPKVKLSTPKPKDSRPRKNAVPSAEDIFLEAQIDIFNFTTAAEFKLWLSIDPDKRGLGLSHSEFKEPHIPQKESSSALKPSSEDSITSVETLSPRTVEDLIHGSALKRPLPEQHAELGNVPHAAPEKSQDSSQDSTIAPGAELKQWARLGAKAQNSSEEQLTLGLWLTRPHRNGAMVALDEHSPAYFMARYRVYESDCNSLSFLTEQSLLTYCQHARYDFFWEYLSFDLKQYLRQHQLYLFQVESQERFFAPIPLGTEIVVSVVPLKVQRSSIIFYQEIRDRSGMLRFAQKSRHACCEQSQGLQVNIPDQIFEALVPKVAVEPVTLAL